MQRSRSSRLRVTTGSRPCRMRRPRWSCSHRSQAGQSCIQGSTPWHDRRPCRRRNRQHRCCLPRHPKLRGPPMRSPTRRGRSQVGSGVRSRFGPPPAALASGTVPRSTTETTASVVRLVAANTARLRSAKTRACLDPRTGWSHLSGQALMPQSCGLCSDEIAHTRAPGTRPASDCVIARRVGLGRSHEMRAALDDDRPDVPAVVTLYERLSSSIEAPIRWNRDLGPTGVSGKNSRWAAEKLHVISGRVVDGRPREAPRLRGSSS